MNSTTIAQSLDQSTNTSFHTIGVRGKAGSGKDTVADLIGFLLTQKKIQSIRSAFANAIREDVSRILEIPVEVIKTTEGKNMKITADGFTVGRFLQLYGAIKRQLKHTDIWATVCLDRLPAAPIISILSDVRFKAEQAGVKARNGVVILVTTTRKIDPEVLAGRSETDPSECDLDGIAADYIIENNGTLMELGEKVRALVNQLYPTV